MCFCSVMWQYLCLFEGSLKWKPFIRCSISKWENKLRVDIVLSFGKQFSVYLNEGSQMTNHVSV